MRIGFLGAGNMAFAMAGAVLSGNDTEVSIFDVSPERTAVFTKDFPRVEVAFKEADLLSSCDAVVLAVKPQIMPQVMETLNGLPSELTGPEGPLFISIAAGLPLKFFSEALPGARIARVMPNTPALVGEAASGFTMGAGTTAEDRSLVRSFLAASGRAEEVPEELMDAVTALSGSGPAFFGRIAEAFIEAGCARGLSADVARTLVLQTMKGTAALLEEKGMSPEELVTMVSSPKGTTVAGREVLEASNYKDIINSTVARAAERSEELGK